MSRFQKITWSDSALRREQLDDAVIRKNKTRFGSEELSETEKANRVRRHFESVAQKYDLMNTLLSMGIHYLWKASAVRKMGLRPGRRVLDVCGGTGDLAVMAQKKAGPSGMVAVYDINREMIRAGRMKKTNTRARKEIAWIQGDAESIAFPDGVFDVVMVGFAIRNITHMQRAFSEMHRVLKPGGHFMCLEFSRPVFPPFRKLYDWYSFSVMPWLGEMITGSRRAYVCLPETIRLFLLPEELSEVFRQTGFSGVSYRLLTNGIAAVHTGVKPLDGKAA